MSQNVDADSLAADLMVSIKLLVRRVRQLQTGDELTLPETAALARLDREGPATASALARMEQISPQSMGATIAALQSRGLIARKPDPADGRRVLLSPTAAGRRILTNRRTERNRRVATVLATEFSAAERNRLRAAAPLIERLAKHI